MAEAPVNGDRRHAVLWAGLQQRPAHLEEAQHAMLDTLMVAELAKDMPQAEIVRAVDGYLEIGAMIDDGLKQRTLFDLAALMRATGRRLGEAEHASMAEQQRRAPWDLMLGAP